MSSVNLELLIVWLGSFLFFVAWLATRLLSRKDFEAIHPERRVASPPSNPAPPPTRRRNGNRTTPAPQKRRQKNETEPATPPAAPPPAAAPQAGAAAADPLQEILGQVTRFTEDAVMSVARGGIDAQDRFGLHLFLAGACDAAGRQQGVGANGIKALLAATAQKMGTPQHVAERFAGQYSDYLLEPKYNAMFRAGTSAMAASLSSGRANPAATQQALQQWRNTADAGADASQQMLAILFTDIVGSTAMTERHGDEGADALVQTHDRIVREALRRHGGREVKHTGDGILATFRSIHDSVRASIFIQQQLAQFNTTSQGPDLEVRIGINAGEPVSRDNDIYGQAVQISARLCAAAKPNQILASDSVRQLCQGKNIPFTAAGRLSLKGLKEPLTAYLVTWS